MEKLDNIYLEIPTYKDGSWDINFTPDKWGDAFTEGSSWHWTWCVFHDPLGLAESFGGIEKMRNRLDEVFTAPPTFNYSYYGQQIHEITEMIVANSSSAINVVMANEFSRMAAYPNPFNPVTSIRYNLEDNSNVKITIYDLLGNVINELFQGNQSAGFNNISWNATNSVGESVSTGVYIYKIQTDASFKIGRMMYLK